MQACQGIEVNGGCFLCMDGGGPLMMLVSTSTVPMVRYFVIAWSLYTM